MTYLSPPADASEQPLRVGFVSLRAYPLFNPAVTAVFGGAEVDLYLLATELARDAAFDVRFVVADYGQPDGERIEDVRLHKSLRVDRNLFLGGRRIWRALRRAAADIYMSEACSLGTVLYSRFCRSHGRPFVYRTAHSRECDGTYRRNHPWRGRLIRRAYRRAQVIITQNERDATDLRRTTGLESLVIRNAVRPAERTGPKEDFILWAGRSVAIKQPRRLLQLAGELPRRRFVMICPPDENDGNYEDLAAAAGGIGNLTFLRGVAYRDMGGYFARARLLVCTSDGEGFPNTYVQACQMATPIVSLKVNPDGFLTRYECGLCADGDWTVFRNRVDELMDSDRADALGANGRRYVEEHHDIRRIVEQYKRIFRRLAGRDLSD